MKILLKALHIKQHVQDRLLLNIDRLQIYQNDRIGLVGKNGSGKTTLLHILDKKSFPEEGTVTQYSRCELIPQLKYMETTKSGGEVTQKYIQQSLVKKPELLLADEPTTNLDTNYIESLERKLKDWHGAFIIVSHDRAFLDALCTTIWEIKDGDLIEYKGNYSDYIEQKELEGRQAQLAYEKYEKKKEQLEEAVKLKEEKANRATKKPKNLSSSEARLKGAKTYFANKQKKLQKTAKSLETRVDKLEKVERTKELPSLKMDILNSENFKNRIILRVEDVSGVIEERILWKAANFNVRGGDKLAIIGSNGTGKTTFIKKILQDKPGISLSPSVKIGYFSQNLDILELDKTILENVQSSSRQNETFIRTILARMHFFRDDVHKPVNVLSGGERVKVALVKVFLSNVNTLVLDEPTNFLDMEAIEAFESLLEEYEGSVIFVSHDRKFIEKIATRIMIIDNKEIKIFEGTYSQFKDRKAKEETRDEKENKKLLLEMRIAETISRLSIEPSEELEKEFQNLTNEKRKLDN
ncbi:Vga family ABC-F type ribosomal protection protein [Staphylococcus felis]|uniref:Vga family ABC-F type ribosomal protection protein n=1 Tax=Staphylococcus felis TaxID=46127 RepID=UPI003966DD72